jgi:hypothetical protein
MKINHLPIGKVKLNPANPRQIGTKEFMSLVKSLRDCPQMFEARPLLVSDRTGKYIVLGGNMRLRAAQKLRYKEVPVIVLPGLTEAQEKEITIKDNGAWGEWDFDALANAWSDLPLKDWGVNIPDDWLSGEGEGKKDEAKTKLSERFVVPPFSVLDTRQGYWQERKRYWRELIGDLGESRENALGESREASGEWGSIGGKKMTVAPNVSILDPVLSEIVNSWFGLENCKTFDPFAGDTVFGFVSGYMGNKFTGIELRQEQCDINNERVKEYKAKYICDDGQNVLKHIKPNSQDLLFSCPPYFDLEVYSDLPNDASNQNKYEDFLKILVNAFTDAIKCLKDNRFAVIAVGDIRDKKGFYRRFVDDIKDIFKKNNLPLYNEMVLVEQSGTAALRADKIMVNRKVVKTHQNVLVFFKGDPKQIKSIYPKIEVCIDECNDMAL